MYHCYQKLYRTTLKLKQEDTGNLLVVILVIELLLLYPSEIDKLISIFYSNIYIHYFRDNRLNTGYLWLNR